MNDDQTPKGTDDTQPEGNPEELKPEAPAVDYEKKFAESTRENQLLREQLAAEQKNRQELTKEPTDSDYRAAFPEWDVLDDGQKADKRRIFNAERASYEARQIAKELQDERSRNTSIELAIASNSALQGRESQFRQFASRPQYKNVPSELLVDAFIGKNPVQAPAPTPAPKKASLLSGNGGPKEPEKPKTLSGKELKQLRESDYQAWVQYTSTHDINLDEE